MKKWFIVLAVAAVIAGCGFSQNLSEKAERFEVPVSFSDSGSAEIPAQWWIVFDDRDLNNLISIAMKDNYSLKTAWDRLDQAASAAKAAGAKMWPGVSGDAGVMRSMTWNDFGGANVRTFGTDISLGLSASYELDMWGKNSNSKRASVYDTLASQQNVYTSAITLTSQIASTWYNIIGQNIQIRLLERQIKINDTYLVSLEQRFKQGLVSATDILQVRSQIEAARGDLENVKASFEILKHQLAVMCGKAPGTLNLPIPDAFPAIPEMPSAGIPADLIKRRPDVEAAFLRIKAADARAASAVAARFPSLSFSARGETSDGEVTGLFTNWFGNFIANLGGPLLDGGRLKAEAERSQASAREALNNYKGIVLSSLADVENALVREKRQMSYVLSIEKQFSIAKTVLERTKDSFANGLVDYLRVLTAIQSHDRLQRSVASAQLNLIQYRIALYRALGGPWKLKHYNVYENTNPGK